MQEDRIEKLITFAESEEAIRALILEGSRAVGRFSDDLSDYDMNVFTLDAGAWLENDQWLEQFGEVLLYQKETLAFHSWEFPSRLVVFKDGGRIDFSFWPPDALAGIADGSQPYESYRNGYQVLVDKDGLTEHLPKPDGLGFLVLLPDRDHFLQTLYDFWFEAYCIARALARSDLWYAKRIEASAIKDHLYQMILWERQRRLSWSHDPILHLGGKRFEKWASPELLAAIAACYSPYSKAETWQSLIAMLDLFNRIARRLAGELGFAYPEKKEKEILEYFSVLQRKSGKS